MLIAWTWTFVAAVKEHLQARKRRSRGENVDSECRVHASKNSASHLYHCQRHHHLSIPLECPWSHLYKRSRILGGRHVLMSQCASAEQPKNNSHLSLQRVGAGQMRLPGHRNSTFRYLFFSAAARRPAAKPNQTIGQDGLSLCFPSDI